jgi:hypothetical protein
VAGPGLRSRTAQIAYDRRVGGITGPAILGAIGVAAIFAAICASPAEAPGFKIPGPGPDLARQILLGAFGLALGVGAALWAVRNEHAKVFRIDTPSLTIEPAAYDGGPPCQVQFTATIHTSGGHSGTVWYRLEDERPGFSDFKQLHFDTPGVQAVNFQFVVHPREYVATKGFVRIYAPERRDSRHVPFSINCR